MCVHNLLFCVLTVQFNNHIPICFFVDEPDAKGTYFVVGFLDNNSTLNPELLVIPQSDRVVNISVRMPNNANFESIFRSVHPGEIAILDLDSSVRMSGEKLGTRGELHFLL